MNDEAKVRQRHSGASILRIYIPDYKKEPLTVDEEAELVAQELVSEFGKMLQAGIKESRTGKGTGSESRLA